MNNTKKKRAAVPAAVRAERKIGRQPVKRGRPVIWRAGFKAITKDTRLSSLAYTHKGAVAKGDLVPVLYPVGKVAKPRKSCGPLAVFTDRSFAEQFAGSGTHLMVVPCLYRKSRRVALRQPKYAEGKSNVSATSAAGGVGAEAVRCLS